MQAFAFAATRWVYYGNGFTTPQRFDLYAGFSFYLNMMVCYTMARDMDLSQPLEALRMPNSNCGPNAGSNMVKGLERWRLGASRPRSMPDQLWGTAGLSQGCAVRQSGGHTEAYGEAASPALTIRFGNNRAQSRTVSTHPASVT